MAYKAELEMAGQIHKGEGETFVEALNSIPLTYLDIKYKGVLKVSNGGRSFEKFFFLKPLRRFFANKMVRLQCANQFERLMK